MVTVTCWYIYANLILFLHHFHRLFHTD
jgi:hypothetical protein